MTVYDAIAVNGALKEVVEYGAKSPIPPTGDPTTLDQTGVTSSPEAERSSPDDPKSLSPKKPSPPKMDYEALQAANVKANEAKLLELGLAKPPQKPKLKPTRKAAEEPTPKEQVPCYITLTLHWCYTWCYTWCNTHRI